MKIKFSSVSRFSQIITEQNKHTKNIFGIDVNFLQIYIFRLYKKNLSRITTTDFIRTKSFRDVCKMGLSWYGNEIRWKIFNIIWYTKLWSNKNKAEK